MILLDIKNISSFFLIDLMKKDLELGKCFTRINNV